MIVHVFSYTMQGLITLNLIMSHFQAVKNASSFSPELPWGGQIELILE